MIEDVGESPTNAMPHPEADATRQSFLERLRGMDPKGWEELYRRYRQMIIARAMRAGLNPADAEDVVQTVFAAVAKNPPGPSPRTGAFRAWLREQTRWRITDKLREAGRHGVAPMPSEAEGLTGPLDTLAADDDFARHWDAEFARHVHEVAQRRLAAEVSAEHLQIYQLTEEQGWSVSRVARQFRIAAATVYVVRHRVGSRLKAHVAAILRELDEGALAETGANDETQG